VLAAFEDDYGSPARRSYRTPLGQLLDASGAAAATLWSAGAALASSYLVVTKADATNTTVAADAQQTRSHPLPTLPSVDSARA
jgi:hypothetical protein